MKDYAFKLLQEGSLVGEGYGQGNSAIEAFENGIDMLTIYLPNGNEVEVLALSGQGLGIKFTAYKM